MDATEIELNERVAVGVLGYRIATDPPRGYRCPDGGARWLVAPDGSTHCLNCDPETLPDFSRDIALAWEVVGAMESLWWWFVLETFPNPHGMNDGATVRATFKPTSMPSQPAEDVSAEADDAALAICRAAVLATESATP
jgi:hypothetical protein